jgi:hypothetical protein
VHSPAPSVTAPERAHAARYVTTLAAGRRFALTHLKIAAPLREPPLRPVRFAQHLLLPAEIAQLRLHASEQQSAEAVETPARCSIAISRSCARIGLRMRAISLRTQSSFTARSGPQARCRISGSAWRPRIRRSRDPPLRLNAIAPTWPDLRDSASARITAALALKHSVASPGAMPSSEGTNGRAT